MTVHTGAFDIHAHAMPLALLEWLASKHLADLSELDRNVVRIDSRVSGLAPGAPIPCPPEMIDVARHVDSMQRAGIAAAAVSAPPFVFAANADDALCMDVVQASNDALAEWIAPANDCLVGLGTAPVGRERVVAEATRCIENLGFAGLVIGSSGADRELDDPVNQALWEHVDATQEFVFLHPSRASSPERLRDYHLVQLVGYPAETALAAARLVYGGVLERWNPALCLAHGGGCCTALYGRLDLGWQRKSVCQTITQAPSELLKRLLYDTAVFDPVLLGQLVDRVGADHVLLGTDFPFDLADRAPMETLGSLGLGEGDTQLIAGGNARRVLGLH